MRKRIIADKKITAIGVNVALLATLACAGGGDPGSTATVEKAPNLDSDSTLPADTSSLPTALPTTPPPPLTSQPRCIVSADCPAGAHCDLGECVQGCNSERPCSAGLTCSARARCVAAAAQDVDPKPSRESKGTISASAPTRVLTESDAELPITLTSTSKGPVNYRVEVEGAHLSIENPRGQFTRTKVVTIKNDATQFVSQDVPGTVRIFTDLGEATVAANLHAGSDGFYRGALTYNDGHIKLGDARIRLALSKSSGGVLAQIDPSASLLFPVDEKLGLAAAQGYGTMSGQLLTLTVAQRVPKAFGGERNHLGRDIGRQLTFLMKPLPGGGWKGQFEERITGLFVQPVVNTGTVTLAYEGRQGMTPLTVGSAVAPVVLGTSELTRALPGWTAGDCVTTIQSAAGCPGVAWGSPQANERATCLGNTLYAKYVAPLFEAVGGTPAVPYAQLADECAQSLTATSPSAVPNTALDHCGIVPIVECGVQLAAQSDVTQPAIGAALNKLVDGAISPALLVAQERMMKALDLSKNSAGSIANELSNYDQAAAALNRAANWVYQPVVLEGLRKLTRTVAAGTATPTLPPYVDFPAARAISKLNRTLRDMEAERTRLNAIGKLNAPGVRRAAAQASALSAYLEGAALNTLLDSWGNAPESVGAESSQLLGPFDEAFGAALQGAGVFGVPDSFVPFVYDPKDAIKGKNNFEQMLNIAAAQVSLYSSLEGTYVTASRELKANQYELSVQAQDLESQYDHRIAQLCGSDFDIDAAQSSMDVSSCGATSGEVASMRTQRDASNLGLEGALGQLKAMRDKIAIDTRVMIERFKLHEQNLRFINDQGKSYTMLTWAEGIINAQQIAITTVAQSSALNGFMPAALAIPMVLLEMQRTNLQVARQDLQTAQQMHFERQGAVAEQLEAQGNIEKQNIDLAQFRLQIQQSVYDQTVASNNFATALAGVQLLLEERAAAQRLITLNPANDPAHRLVRDSAAIKMLGARSRAQKYLFLASRALEYELNQPIADLGKAVLVARNASSMNLLQECLATMAKGHAKPEPYLHEVSVRRMLGITGVREDSCTGERLSAAQQFQRVLLQNSNLDGKGGATIRFATNLEPGNGLWGSDVCNDRITGVEVQLVGDFLGDNEAQVNLSLSGAAIMRSCNDKDLTSWSLGRDAVDGLGTAVSVIQAGVNSFGKAATNTSLYGQSVARAEWILTIPGGTVAPTNSDVDLTKLDDIVLKIAHEATAIGGSGALGVDLSCLAQVM